MKKHTWKRYALWVLPAEAVGGLAGWLTRDGMKTYLAEAAKPPLSPPSIVFPIVWTVLFALMGIGAARIDQSPVSRERTRGLRLFWVQLLFNFLWTILFFGTLRFDLAFFWLLALWALILWMLLTFRRVDPPAAWMQLPYLLWVTFAAYLNLGVWLLNGAQL